MRCNRRSCVIRGIDKLTTRNGHADIEVYVECDCVSEHGGQVKDVW